MNLALTIRRHRRELSVAVAYAALLAILAAAAPRFFLADQIRAMLVSNAPVLVAAVGMTLVILSPGDRHLHRFPVRDLWRGRRTAGEGRLADPAGGDGDARRRRRDGGAQRGTRRRARLAVDRRHAGDAGHRPRRACAMPAKGSSSATCRPASSGSASARRRASGSWSVVALAVFAAVAWGLRNLAAGRAVYATGSDPEAARLAGIRPRRVVFAAFVAMGALTALAAWLNAVRFADVDPNAGNGLELRVIAAVVVGGVAISGGRGTAARHPDRRRLARLDRPGLGLPRRPGAVGKGRPGAHHPPRRRLRRARTGGTLTWPTIPLRSTLTPPRLDAWSPSQAALARAARG